MPSTQCAPQMLSKPSNKVRNDLDYKARNIRIFVTNELTLAFDFFILPNAVISYTD